MATRGIPDRYRNRIIVSEDGCWVWTGCVTSSGYGRTWDGTRATWAHRALYEVCVGEIPVGHELDHLCHSAQECVGGPACPHRRCVNPTHLEPVAHLVNVRRGGGSAATARRHAAQQHCKRGHPLSGDNLRINSDGARGCRKCRKASWAKYRLLRKQERQAQERERGIAA